MKFFIGMLEVPLILLIALIASSLRDFFENLSYPEILPLPQKQYHSDDYRLLSPSQGHLDYQLHVHLQHLLARHFHTKKTMIIYQMNDTFDIIKS